jgi:hypothetical protein
MSFVIKNPLVGVPQITDHTTDQKMPLGARVNAYDPTYGEGEFVYAKGVASTVLGSWVTFNEDDWSTALLAANAIGQVGIAMSACVAGE